MLTSQWEVPLTFTTSMIPPDKICTAEDGKAIFMVDATGDWRWCIAPDDPNSVFDAERYEAWDKNSEQLADFLLHNTVREVVYGATAKIRAIAVPKEVLKEILAPFEEIAFGAWKWPTPGYRIFMGDAMIAETVESESGIGWEVEIVAPRLSQLSRFQGISRVKWQMRTK